MRVKKTRAELAHLEEFHADGAIERYVAKHRRVRGNAPRVTFAEIEAEFRRAAKGLR